jgi:hypothetical protein
MSLLGAFVLLVCPSWRLSLSVKSNTEGVNKVCTVGVVRNSKVEGARNRF